METLFGVIVLAAFACFAYFVWYVPRETTKKANRAASGLLDATEKADKK